MLGNYLQQMTSADDIFRYIFFLALLGLNRLSAKISSQLNFDDKKENPFPSRQGLINLIFLVNHLPVTYDSNEISSLI